MQSDRLFNALKGLGGVVKLVKLPAERHGYRARESILHSLHEQYEWLRQHVAEAKVSEEEDEIEESEDRPRSAVVAITANALNDERANCMAAGMDTVLTKPVRLALLRETVAEWMAEALRERVRARPDEDLPLRFSQR